jgi:acyl-ACP thioesterase
VPAPQPLAPRNPAGRVFTGDRKVRLGDVDPRGRLRFDALTRYTQDVSDDDTSDAGLDDRPGWVVRSTVVDELVPAGLGEWLHFETFCSGLGSRWAERRLSIGGDRGAHYEVATLWVCIDAESGRPHRLTDQFRDRYGEAAGDRRVSARLVNPPPPAPPGESARWSRWQLRVVDFDIYGHVNNAAYWAAVEQWIGHGDSPRRVRQEYGRGVAEMDEVDILVDEVDAATGLWWLPVLDPPVGSGADGPADPRSEAAASAVAIDLPVDLYTGSVGGGT